MRPTNCGCGGTIFLSDEMIRQYQATFRANGQESRGSFLEEKELKAWQKPNLECQTLWISEMDWNELNLWINQFWSDLKWFFGDGCRRRITALVLANLSWASMNASAPVCDLIQSRHCDALLQKKNRIIFGSQKSKSFLKLIDQLSFSLEDPKKTAVGSTFAWPGVWDNMQDGKCRKQSLFEIGQCQNISCRFI